MWNSSPENGEVRSLFEYTDAFIYGYLIGLNIDIPKNPNKNIGTSNIGIGVGSGPFGPPLIVEMGRGGGIRGENGKPRPGDIAAPGNQLAGGGGEQTDGGKGQHNGDFGFGGNAGFGISAGGGAGWYGGGSSTIQAGGGGGSGFVWCLELKNNVPPDYSVPEELMAISAKMNIGDHVGNGQCIITDPTEHKTTFEFTGNVQEYIVPYSGVYRILCYGAQGGGIGQTDEQLSGGFGGTAEGVFYLEAGLKLYIYVGQQGRISSVNRPFNGGGTGDGGCGDGGGATDVRLLNTADIDREGLCSRLIVAGGGGGAGILGGNNPVSDDVWLEQIGKNPNFNPDQNTDISQGITIDLGNVLVSDLSNLHVDMYYTASYDTNANMIFQVYVDNKRVFNRDTYILKGGGYQNEEFHFWDILPEYTEAYIARVIVKIYPQDDILIPEGGLKAWIETPTRLIDNNNPNSKPYNRPVLTVTNDYIYFNDSVAVDIIEVEPNKSIVESDGFVIDDDVIIDIIEISGDINKIVSENLVISDDVVVDTVETGSKSEILSEQIVAVDAVIINISEPNNKNMVFGDSVIVTEEDTNG